MKTPPLLMPGRWAACFMLLVLALTLGGCANAPDKPGASSNENRPAPAPSVTDLMANPAESALIAGLQSYENAQYPQAEKQLQNAIARGLAASKDRATAHKHLAFIYCMSNRMKECETSFRSARAAMPSFRLSKGEAGHPLWGPVYRRVVP
jgi:Tfp pilus assembly protein PilF